MLKSKTSILLITLLLTLVLIAGCGGGQQADKSQSAKQQSKATEEQKSQAKSKKQSNALTVQGSTTVLPIAQKAAEVYMDQNSEVNITVRGGGSGNGIAALIDNATDIADASRMIRQNEVQKAVENGVYPVPHRIAMDGIAVVVHPSNPVKNLTLAELERIYTGKVENWKELGGKDQEIVVASRDSSSGTYEVFSEIAVDGKRVTKRALMQSSNGTIVSTVVETKGAIGYVGLSYLSSELKAIKVNGVKPSNATVASGHYPIARPLFMFTNGWPTGLTGKFINFVKSKQGQKIVESQGYVPLH